MGLITHDTGDTEFVLVPEGLHRATCTMLVDVGIQRVTWMEETKEKRQIFVRWELPDELMEDGRPMTIGRIYTNSLGKKANLRKDLEGWRGRSFTAEELEGFDLTQIAGKPCQITVTHRHTGDRTYANVISVAQWPKGMDVPPPHNPIVIFDTDNPSNLDELPPWLQTKFAERVMPGDHTAEYVPPPESRVDIGEDIPF